MSIKIASHLFRNRHGTFYFRLVVPKDLQDYLNQREIRFSLQTEKRQDVNRRPRLSTNRRPIVSTFRLIEHCFCGV